MALRKAILMDHGIWQAVDPCTKKAAGSCLTWGAACNRFSIVELFTMKCNLGIRRLWLRVQVCGFRVVGSGFRVCPTISSCSGISV